MQMVKMSSTLYDYQLNKKLLYVSILTSTTTGGVTASLRCVEGYHYCLTRCLNCICFQHNSISTSKK